MAYPDNEITANEYQALALRTEYTPDFVRNDTADLLPLARLLHGMIGAATEVGELQDAVKKHLIYAKPLDRVNILEECGDVLWYIGLCLYSQGYSMTECMSRNIEKLRARYPQKFTAEQANVRDLVRERVVLEAGLGGQTEDQDTRNLLNACIHKALQGPNRPSYCDDPSTFTPHPWVVDAVRLAYETGGDLERLARAPEED